MNFSISSADRKVTASFASPALCAFTRFSISALLSGSSKKGSLVGLGFSETSTDMELALAPKDAL